MSAAAAIPGRVRRTLLLASFLPTCWLGMMIVHETGHVLAAWSSGGQVARVVLSPFAISRTELSENPHPLLVAWGGALVGAGLPLLARVVAAPLRLRGRHLVRFFAGFCLVANGAYLGIGSLTGDADAGDLLAAGAPPWQLWSFSITALAVGLGLWHRLGPAFGFGLRGERITAGQAWGSAAVLVVIVAAELAFSGSGLR